MISVTLAARAYLPHGADRKAIRFGSGTAPPHLRLRPLATQFRQVDCRERFESGVRYLVAAVNTSGRRFRRGRGTRRGPVPISPPVLRPRALGAGRADPGAAPGLNRYPQPGFSVARLMARARRARGDGWSTGPGAPRRPSSGDESPMQPRMVAGVTSSPRRRPVGSSRVSAAVRARSAQLIRGRGVRRPSTAS